MKKPCFIFFCSGPGAAGSGHGAPRRGGGSQAGGAAREGRARRPAGADRARSLRLRGPGGGLAVGADGQSEGDL